MSNMKEYCEAYDNLSFTEEQKAQIAARAAEAAKKARKKEKRNTHFISKFVAAAACLLSVVTITAEAAGYETPVSEILAPIFGGSVAQTEVIDKIGRPIDASDTDNGVTIRADAIIGDEYSACIVFTIHKDDGTPILPEGADVRALRLGGFCDLSFDNMGGTHGSAGFVDTVPGDNEIQYIYTVSADEPLNKGWAEVTFKDLYWWNTEEEVKILDGKWRFRFDIDYEDSSVKFDGGETFQQGGMNFTITGISVSPIAVRVAYEVDSEVQWTNAESGRLPEEDKRQMERYQENVEILLTKKDGTVMDLSLAGGSVKPENGRTYCVKSTTLDEVVPMEELASISVGGVVYAISESNR